MKIPDLTITDLVKNLIAVGIIVVTLLLYVLQATNPNVIFPAELKLAAGAVLAAYGYQVVSTEKAKAAAARKPPDKPA